MLKKKILVVDDDPTVRKLSSEVLKHEGYEVLIAQDGIDAMVMIRQEKPDLLLLDVVMPEFNGYEVCHSLKFDPKFKDLPIIILTVREQELDPRLGNLMGIEYLHKPCSSQELLRKVQQTLSK
ncbi:MAG: response regulator [Candidatus Omnitrophica bacterium]|nr:response regulator [Candidatus Omnitrophota bacterium]